MNEDQDPRAIEKITAKLDNLLMSNEEIGYIAVQKKPAITVFPDSIVVTNKRIILCKPKNLGLSMEFMDYDWEDVAGSFVKEGILGADFTFTTKSDLTHTVDYLPKNQARKLYTYSKEQLDRLKNLGNSSENMTMAEDVSLLEIEDVPTEEVTSFTEIMPIEPTIVVPDTEIEAELPHEKGLKDLSKEELFEKLQNYKKLLDNGLILQGEYDRLKNEIIAYL
ncbi:MAG: PH domain-containing protein [Flavobacterium sp.]